MFRIMNKHEYDWNILFPNELTNTINEEIQEEIQEQIQEGGDEDLKLELKTDSTESLMIKTQHV